jgi:5-methyltetrahydrofolate--homocysteine methyltransferase
MSAESAKCAFEVIKKATARDETQNKGTFVLATVRGDIHDIGKNIVKLMLENYGFDVVDLGKDVPTERVVETVIKTHAPLVGLSALMTTTVPAMEDTVKLLRERAPWCKIIVGGAVLTAEYAKKIGADGYAKDAMEAVRVAQSFIDGEVEQ